MGSTVLREVTSCEIRVVVDSLTWKKSCKLFLQNKIIVNKTIRMDSSRRQIPENITPCYLVPSKILIIVEDVDY